MIDFFKKLMEQVLNLELTLRFRIASSSITFPWFKNSTYKVL